MGLFSLFSGKSPEALEQKADALFSAGDYGPAKLAYENALAKQSKRSVVNAAYEGRLTEKLHQAKEHLALEHKKNGEELIDADCHADAEELFRLALELTRDSGLKAELEKKLEKISDHFAAADDGAFEYSDWADGPAVELEDGVEASDEEYFSALCNSLTESEQDAYRNYGDFFKGGYIALNRGDFEGAVIKLSQAMEDNPSAGSYIPLELATAHLNLGNLDDARDLLGGFLKDHPESVRGYQLMCELCWEEKAFSEALTLLAGCPKALSRTLPMRILEGETLFQAQRFQEAVDLYQAMMTADGWDNTVAQLLAKSYEALGHTEKARDLYGEIMNTCHSCHRRVDPLVKQRYAETSFEAGDMSTQVLEIYFELTQADTDNRAHYFQRISKIYERQGNEREAARFRSYAKKEP